jgi:hypothetical protein
VSIFFMAEKRRNQLAAEWDSKKISRAWRLREALLT